MGLLMCMEEQSEETYAGESIKKIYIYNKGKDVSIPSTNNGFEDAGRNAIDLKTKLISQNLGINGDLTWYI